MRLGSLVPLVIFYLSLRSVAHKANPIFSGNSLPWYVTTKYTSAALARHVAKVTDETFPVLKRQNFGEGIPSARLYDHQPLSSLDLHLVR